MKIEPGMKLLVIRGGMVYPFRDKSGIHVKPGEVWDVIQSSFGVLLRKLNKNGSSTRVLNGVCFALCMIDEQRVKVLTPDDPEHKAHTVLCQRLAFDNFPTPKRSGRASRKNDNG